LDGESPDIANQRPVKGCTFDSFAHWRGGPIGLQCNKARKERVLKHHHTTHRRSIKTAALTGALACVIAAGLEIRPSHARSHHHTGGHHAGTHHAGSSDAGLHETSHALGTRRVAYHYARLHHEASRHAGTRHVEASVPRTHAEHGYEGSGLASVYSDGRTASGEHMNPGAMTAAHRTLPFGTMVTVVNNRNGRSVTVRINDRGPFVHGRVIDLSPAAARVIGVDGLAPVSLIVGRRA
jgi:rare lipoprotein A